TLAVKNDLADEYGLTYSSPSTATFKLYVVPSDASGNETLKSTSFSPAGKLMVPGTLNTLSSLFSIIIGTSTAPEASVRPIVNVISVGSVGSSSKTETLDVGKKTP